MNFFKKLFKENKKEIEEVETLVEETSPSCPITAVVEQDSRVAYFYLWGPEQSNFGVKSCWIRNLKEAPDKVNSTLMEKGIPPMLTKNFCEFPLGQEKLKKEDLSIVWLEEGDGAALFENNNVISIIPSWGGQGGFHGYARDCKGQGDFAWELNDSNEMNLRVKDSIDFWNSWDNEINPFQIEQPKILDLYSELFGESDKYFAIDDKEGAPKGLYLRKGEHRTVFATVALSIPPMPQVEMYGENRFKLNRIELGMMLKSNISDESVKSIAEWISGTSSIPWRDITFLGEGHTIYFDAFNNHKFKNVLLTKNLSLLPKVKFEPYRQSDINFLWMVPISDKEKQLAMDKGSESLIIELKKIGENIFSLDREEVIQI